MRELPRGNFIIYDIYRVPIEYIQLCLKQRDVNELINFKVLFILPIIPPYPVRLRYYIRF